VDQVLQVFGALLLLAAFAAGQFGLLDARSYPNLLLNAAGSAILAVLAAIDRQWGFLLLEGVWALVSFWGLAGRLIGRDAGAAPRHRSRRRCRRDA
jgi:hypothetical protein